MEGISAILTGSPITATGGILSAPLSTTRPTDAVTALPAGFVKKGYVGEDGVTKTVDKTDEKIKAWGGSTVKIVRQEHSVSYSWTFLESGNAEVLKAIYGADNVIITPATVDHGAQIEVRETGQMLPRESWLMEMKDGDTAIREYVPDGQLAVSGDVQFVHSNVISYTVTLEAFPDANGVKSYTWMDDGKKTA